MKKDFIERQILIGLIMSDEYAEFFHPYKTDFLPMLQSASASMLAGWVLDYFERYSKTPKADMMAIFQEKVASKLFQKEKIEDIASILDGLSEEFERTVFNHAFLIDHTKEYMKERSLLQLTENIKGAVQQGKLLDAQTLISGFEDPIKNETSFGVDLFDSPRILKEAFSESAHPLLRLHGALGEFMNSQLTRDAFVVFMAPEKRGKTFWLMELAMQAYKNGNNVAFFQCGDMTEAQFFRRVGIYLSKKSDKEEYCKNLYKPIIDCKENQNGSCNKKERENQSSLFELGNGEPSFEELVTAIDNTPEYEPCRACKNIKHCVYLKRIPDADPLTWKEAWRNVKKWRGNHENNFKLSSHANKTLSIFEVKKILKCWQKESGFIPDVLVIDYMDLLINDPHERHQEVRHSINSIWQSARSLSQEYHVLLLSATQASASSYHKPLISIDDFSEDKRKYSHITAMYGLNTTPEEKKKGILRINELLLREGSFDESNQVTILQKLEQGRPYIGSWK